MPLCLELEYVQWHTRVHKYKRSNLRYAVEDMAYTERMPFLDEMDYVGVAKLRRKMTAEDLRGLNRPMLVIGPGQEALAIVITMKQYRVIQELIMEGLLR